jgi:aspartate kinase
MDGSNGATGPARRLTLYPRGLRVLKFGGTSVGSAERLRAVVRIVAQAASESRVIVVASALSGVTNTLVAAVDANTRAGLADGLWQRHLEVASVVLRREEMPVFRRQLQQNLYRLHDLFEQVQQQGLTPALRDAVLAMGERLSLPLVTQALQEHGLPASAHDAAALIRTDDTFGEANVDFDTTYRQMQHWYAQQPPEEVLVVTGYIGGTADGRTTTLGRGGSDYAAALFAAGLHADVFERWTDVDGIYTDDPRRNENARRMSHLVLEEAWAWNHAGKLGMHRKALDPLVALGIPVHVRSTGDPQGEGTLILPQSQRHLAPTTG